MIETVKLENGVSIVMDKMESVRSVSFGIFVKNGSIDEDEKTNGMSHFIEHMMFKGTHKRTAKDIACQIDELGGSLNAYTSKEFTCYHAKVLDTHLSKAIDILSDMFFNSKFEQEEIDKEAKVILEEISMYDDSPEDMVFTQLQKNIWKGSTLGYSILGSAKNVQSFKREDFLQYLDKKYVGENTVFAIAGNFNKDEVIEKINKYFGNMKKSEYPSTVKKGQIYHCSKIKTEKDIEQLHLCISFEGVSLNSGDNYKMSILNTILGGGMSSILFQKVREKYGLAYSIYSYNSSYIDNGLFNIYVGLNPNKFDKTLDIIKFEIENIKKEKIKSDTINKTKEQIKSGYMMGLESSSNRMSGLGRSTILTGKFKTPNQVIEKLDSINKDDIDNLIDKIFKIDEMSLSIVGKVENLKI